MGEATQNARDSVLYTLLHCMKTIMAVRLQKCDGYFVAIGQFLRPMQAIFKWMLRLLNEWLPRITFASSPLSSQVTIGHQSHLHYTLGAFFVSLMTPCFTKPQYAGLALPRLGYNLFGAE